MVIFIVLPLIYVYGYCFYFCTFLYVIAIKLCLKMYLKLKSQALKKLINKNRPNFLYAKHNSLYLSFDCWCEMWSGYVFVRFILLSQASTGQPHVCSLNEYWFRRDIYSFMSVFISLAVDVKHLTTANNAGLVVSWDEMLIQIECTVVFCHLLLISSVLDWCLVIKFVFSTFSLSEVELL